MEILYLITHKSKKSEKSLKISRFCTDYIKKIQYLFFFNLRRKQKFKEENLKIILYKKYQIYPIKRSKNLTSEGFGDAQNLDISNSLLFWLMYHESIRISLLFIFIR